MGYGLAARILIVVLFLGAFAWTCESRKAALAENGTLTEQVLAEKKARADADTARAAVEENQRLANEIAAEHAKAEHDSAAAIAKLRRDLASAKRKPPVPAACVAACDDHFAPTRDAVLGLREIHRQAAAGKPSGP